MRTHLIVPKAPRRRYSRLSLEQLEDRQLLAVCDPNGDGVVDRNDAARLAMHYGTASGATERDGDCDGDGAVSLADAAMLQSQVGQRNLDFGDAPQRYRTLLGDDGARHVIRAGFHLGTSIDRDSNGQPSIAANADDMDANGDDEDGVFFLTAPVPGVPQRVRVDASASGVLDAFVDWNRDEDWDDVGEQIFAGQALAAGANFLPYSVPATAILRPSCRPTRDSACRAAVGLGRADRRRTAKSRTMRYSSCRPNSCRRRSTSRPSGIGRWTSSPRNKCRPNSRSKRPDPPNSASDRR